MKKVIFGGFCLLTGMLLFMLMTMSPRGIVYGTNFFDDLAQFVGLGLMILGFILGVKGLIENDKHDPKGT